MLNVEYIDTYGWEPALRGMRNPLNSWDKADSEFNVFNDKKYGCPSCEHWMDPVRLGPNDKSLMRRLIGQGSADHCKFRRMLVIYCDITAPLYWWKEFDTYKVGTIANSCSTMHTLMNEPFTVDMFSLEGWCNRVDNPRTNDPEEKRAVMPVVKSLVASLNAQRDVYLEARDHGDDERARHVWRRIVQLLPESWMQRRTVELNYEVMANIYRARRHHKLQEWHDFIDAMLAELPYPWIFTVEGCSR